MDGTRLRRTRDAVRRRWYATYRCRRFARFLGFRLLGTAEKGMPADQLDRSAVLAR